MLILCFWTLPCYSLMYLTVSWYIWTQESNCIMVLPFDTWTTVMSQEVFVWLWPKKSKTNLTHSLQRGWQVWSSHNASHITCPCVLVWCIIHVAWVQMHCMEGNVKKWAWCCSITLKHIQRDANGMLNKPGSWIIEPFGRSGSPY